MSKRKGPTPRKRPQPDHHDITDNSSVWVTTEPDIDGIYRVKITAGPDHVRFLDRDEVLRYASGILQAAHRAEYDAAVIRQLTTVGIKLDAAVMVVTQMRADRPELDPRDTYPIALTPGVSAYDGKGFLTVHVAGVDDSPGQWDVPAAERHAIAVLGSVEVAELDRGYIQTLVNYIDIDRGKAEIMVDELIVHRPSVR